MRRLLALILPLAAVLAAVPAARADTPATCADLQSKLNAAAPGETIVLSGTCSGASFTIGSTTTLPAHAPITLRAAAPGDGFDGNASGLPILRGTNVGTTTISGLTFKHGGASGSAPAVQLTGAPRIVGSAFLANAAGALSITANLPGATTTIQGNTIGAPGSGNTGPAGAGLNLTVLSGAAVVSGNDISGNTATNGNGGGAYVSTQAGTSVSVTGNRFDGNKLTSASNPADGGGMFLADTGASITIAANRFLENTITAASNARHGAGLAVNATGTTQSHVRQAGNTFDENSIAAAPGGEAGGAGEWIVGTRVDSTRDSFTSNTISHPRGEGAGVGVEGEVHGALLPGELHAADLVADGNRLAVGGHGAGLYAGAPDTCTLADCPSVLELNDSTVAGNCVEPGTGSQAPGLAGSGDDALTLRNSIVYDHQAASACTAMAPLADIAGFGSISAASTDACQDVAGTGSPLSGPDNICADPVLDNPHLGGFHETAASPTIDAGSNARVPAGLSLDADGQPRVTDGNGDGAAFVDMGADESPGNPQPVDTTPPKLTIVSRTVRETATQRVHIRIRCVEQTHCGGTLSLTTTWRHKRYAAGSARFNIVGGRTRTVILKLRKKARSLLNHHSRIRVTAKATARDLAGNVGRTTKHVTVKPRKRLRR